MCLGARQRDKKALKSTQANGCKVESEKVKLTKYRCEQNTVVVVPIATHSSLYTDIYRVDPKK